MALTFSSVVNEIYAAWMSTSKLQKRDDFFDEYAKNQPNVINAIYSIISEPLGLKNKADGRICVDSDKASDIKKGLSKPHSVIMDHCLDQRLETKAPLLVEKAIVKHLDPIKVDALINNLSNLAKKDDNLSEQEKKTILNNNERSMLCVFLMRAIQYSLKNEKEAERTEKKETGKRNVLSELKEKGLPIVEKSGYINRRLAIIKADGTEGAHFSETDILNHLGKITCIIAEGGLGKTTLTQNLWIALGKICHYTACLPCARVLRKDDTFGSLIPADVRILILDGFDEIVEPLEKGGLLVKLKTYLENACTQVIITMRTIADVDLVVKELGEVTRLKLLPFSAQDCKTLANVQLSPEGASVFLDQLGLSASLNKRKTPVVAEWCDNPFYLNKFLSIFMETKTLPETKGQLLAKVLEYTLTQEEGLARLSLDNQEHTLSVKHLYDILTKLAVRKISDNNGLPVVDILETIFSEYNQVDDPHLYATQLFAYLTARGLFLANGEFSHRLFLEYLTALFYWNNIKRENFSAESIKNFFRKFYDQSLYSIQGFIPLVEVIRFFISIVENNAIETTKQQIYATILKLGFIKAFQLSEIRNIRIPGDIKSLPDYMFFDCKMLETVVVEEGVEEVSIMTFNVCPRLTELKIPKSVVSLFYKHPCDGGSKLDIPNLQKIYLPSHLQYVMKGDDRVVVYDAESITLPGTTEIADHAFRGKDIETYQIPEGITAIGNYAFANCTKLREITIPERVNMLGNNCFDGCVALKNIDIPDSVKNIGKEAFRNCLSLNAVCLPKNLKQIPQDCFSTTGIRSIQLPKTCEKICEHAFADSNLESINFPASLVSIGMCAFWMCFSLSRVDLSSCQNLQTIGGCAFSGCHALTFVYLPDGLQEIQPNAFRFCESLSEITIPKSVKAIGQGAFSDCNLKTVRISRKFEHQIEDIFGNLAPGAIRFID